MEMGAHGVATLAAVPLGGIAGSMQLGTSRLLDNAGGTRWAGAACALVMLAAALLNLDLLALIPLPVAAGLVLQLGWGFVVEAFAKPLARRDWVQLALAAAIAAAACAWRGCVRLGYVAGVIGGIVGADPIELRAPVPRAARCGGRLLRILAAHLVVPHPLTDKMILALRL